jgi:peptide/nickel transport system permease protein
MTAYIIRRLFMAVITLWLVTLIVFFAVRLLPGDPLVIFMGQSASSGNMNIEQLQNLRVEYGLDKPIVVQYLTWLGGILTGNLGTSIHYHEKVSTLMLERFPITLYIGTLAILANAIIGVLLGMIAAVRRGTTIDAIATTLANIGMCIPVFWLGLLLMYAFGLKLGWLPIAGYTSPFEDFWLSTKKMIMPVICESIVGLAYTARQMRSSMLEVIQQDYIRTAWSKGLSERVVILRHALRNSLIPVVTLLGIGVSLAFGGSVLVETVFAIPGIGRLLVGSIFAQDYVVIQSGVLVIATIIIMVNLLVDISYGWLDPRIRYS